MPGSGRDSNKNMAHGPTSYASKGICIYCGNSDEMLTDEHIVPYGLGGQHVLKKASCQSCNKVTTKFEEEVLRRLWKDARTSYGAPTRRKQKRARSTHISMIIPGTTKLLQVPATEYPAAIVFYEMGQAGALAGLYSSVDTSHFWGLVEITDQQKLAAFRLRYRTEPTMQLAHVPQSFARMVAKIAYGQVLTSLDPGDFRPYCLPFILGTRNNLSHIVGSNKGGEEPMIPGIGYRLRTYAFGKADHMFLVAEVRLLADNGTPVYHVLVGDVVGGANVARLKGKLAGTDEIVIEGWPLVGDDRLPFWCPKVWPSLDLLP